MTRCVVTVLGMVAFLTCGYKSEAIMAFRASRNKEKGKKQEDQKGKEPLAANLLEAQFWYDALDILSL